MSATADTAGTAGVRLKRRLRTLAGLALVLVVLVAAAAVGVRWRLSRGPVDLERVLPWIENKVSEATSPFTVRIAGAAVRWNGWSGPVGIALRGIEIADGNGRLVADCPRASVVLDQPNLRQGRITALTLEVQGASVHLLRDQAGQLDPEAEQAGFDEIVNLFDPSDQDSAFGRLERVRFQDTKFRLDDRLSGVTWTAENAELTMGRIDRGLELDVALEAASEWEQETPGAGVKPVSIKAQAAYRFDTELFEGRLRFKNFLPSMIVPLDPRLEALRAVGGTYDGGIEATFAERNSLRELRFDIAGEAGTVSGSLAGGAPLHLDVAFSDLRPWRIVDPGVLGEFASVHVPYSGSAGIELTSNGPQRIDFEVNAGPGTIGPFAPMTTGLAIQGGTFRGSISERLRVVRISEGAVILDRSSVTVTVEARETDGTWAGQIEAGLDRLDVAMLDFYWPPGVGVDARRWVVRRIPTGQVTDLKMQLSGSIKPDDPPEIDTFETTFVFDGLEVAALAPQPAIRNVKGRARFGLTQFDFDIEGGDYRDLEIGRGSVELTGLGGEQTVLRVDVPVSGPLSTAIELVMAEPVGLGGRKLPRLETLTGNLSAGLELGLPLGRVLEGNDVDFSVQAQIRDLAWPDEPLGYELDCGMVDLSVNREALVISGEVFANGVPLKVDYEEHFGEADPVRLVGVEGSVNAKQARLLGMPAQPYVSGSSDLIVDFEQSANDSMLLTVDLDLDHAVVDFAPMAWSKPAGDPGSARFKARSTGGGEWSVDPIEIIAGDLVARGALELSTDPTRLTRARVETMAWGENSISGSISATERGGWSIRMEGEQLDLSPFLMESVPRGEDPGSGDERTPRIEIEAFLQSLIIGHTTVDQFSAKGSWGGDSDTELDLRAHVGSGSFATARIAPGGSGRVLEIDCDDAGHMLDAFGLNAEFNGGTLQVRATQTGPGEELSGHVDLSDIQLRNSTLLSQVLRLGSLTGPLNMLQGNGLVFKQAEFDFTLHDSRFVVTEGKALGDGIGITSDGWLDFDTGRIEFHGTVAALARVQRLLGKIPLLGKLLTGKKKGELFASLYSVIGEIEDLEVTVRPYSLLTPGILRDLFTIGSERGASEPGPGASDQSAN